MISPLIKSFKPSFTATVVLFLLAVLFANLGMWQTRRGEEKSVTEQQFVSADILPLNQAIENGSRFAHINVSGHYDTRRHILLDNQVWNGRAGVHVFTPFYTVDGTAILVNRGWLPLPANRQIMPGIPTPQRETVLTGRLNTFPVPGRSLGGADELKTDQWPQLVTYLKAADISESLGMMLSEWIVQLSASEQAGFDGRDWQPVYLSSQKHKAYAFQWFALAGISMVLWVFNGIRKERGNAT